MVLMPMRQSGMLATMLPVFAATVLQSIYYIAESVLPSLECAALVYRDSFSLASWTVMQWMNSPVFLNRGQAVRCTLACLG